MDAARIGLTGVSLGGMHTWLAAAVDERVAAAAPMIGVQYFGCVGVQRTTHACACPCWCACLWWLGLLRSQPHQPRFASLPLAPCSWAVRESLYHARVESIPLVFQAAAADLALQLSAAAAARQQPPGSSCSGDVTPEVVTAVWNVLLPGA